MLRMKIVLRYLKKKKKKYCNEKLIFWKDNHSNL